MRKIDLNYVKSKVIGQPIRTQYGSPFPGTNPLRLYWKTPTKTYLGKFTWQAWKEYTSSTRMNREFVIFDRAGAVVARHATYGGAWQSTNYRVYQYFGRVAMGADLAKGSQQFKPTKIGKHTVYLIPKWIDNWDDRNGTQTSSYLDTMSYVERERRVYETPIQARYS